MRSRAFLAVLVTLTLTGCLRTDVALVVNDDESGTFDVEMLIDRSRMEQLAEMFGEADEDLEDPCAGIRDDLTEGLPEGATATPIEEGSWCGASASIPFANLDELAQVSSQLDSDSSDDDSGDLASDEVTPVGAIAVVRLDDGGYRFDVTGVEMASDDMGEMSSMIEPIVGEMRVTYSVRLPGAPVDHNADDVDGNTFTWQLKFGDTRTELFATTEPGEPPSSGGGNAVWIAVAVAAAVAVAVAAFVLLKRRGGPGDAGDGSGQPSPGVAPWEPPTSDQASD